MAIPCKDFPRIYTLAHSIKGNSSWVGCGRIFNAASQIKNAWLEKDLKGMINLYPALIEAIIETKRYLPIIKEKLM
jgi:hypothetical protein